MVWERYEKLIHQGELPHLRIVPLSRIRFHEETEPHRTRRVAEALRGDGVLRNPPVVGTHPGMRSYLLVDGAHRITGLYDLGLGFALVQIVDYMDPLLELHRWHHVVQMEDLEGFLGQVQILPGVRLFWHRPAEGTSPFFRRRGQMAQIIFPDGRSLLVKPEDAVSDRREWLRRTVRVLRRMDSLYAGTGALVDRISYDDLTSVAENYARWNALIAYPEFTKEDILELMRSRIKLPAGITRHLVPKRALRFNLKLDMLSRNGSAAELNRKLAHTVLERVRARSIRFYSESTFAFDE
jgi:hypothetical protein